MRGLEQAYMAGTARNVEQIRRFEAAEFTKSELMEKTLHQTREELAQTACGAQQWKTQSETSSVTINEMRVQMQHEGTQMKLRMHQESTELKGQMQQEYTTMKGQMHQEATFSINV
jgi:hypothetical protein